MQTNGKVGIKAPGRGLFDQSSAESAKLSPDDLEGPHGLCRDLCVILWSLKKTRIGNGVSAWIFPGGIPEFRTRGQTVP